MKRNIKKSRTIFRKPRTKQEKKQLLFTKEQKELTNREKSRFSKLPTEYDDLNTSALEDKYYLLSWMAQLANCCNGMPYLIEYELPQTEEQAKKEAKRHQKMYKEVPSEIYGLPSNLFDVYLNSFYS